MKTSIVLAIVAMMFLSLAGCRAGVEVPPPRLSGQGQSQVQNG